MSGLKWLLEYVLKCKKLCLRKYYSKFQACWEHLEEACYPSIHVMKFRTYIHCISLWQLSWRQWTMNPLLKCLGCWKSKIFWKIKKKKTRRVKWVQKKHDKREVDCCNFCWMSTRLNKGFLTHTITNLCCFFKFPQTGRSRGFGFVYYESSDDAREVGYLTVTISLKSQRDSCNMITFLTL